MVEKRDELLWWFFFAREGIAGLRGQEWGWMGMIVELSGLLGLRFHIHTVPHSELPPALDHEIKALETHATRDTKPLGSLVATLQGGQRCVWGRPASHTTTRFRTVHHRRP